MLSASSGTRRATVWLTTNRAVRGHKRARSPGLPELSRPDRTSIPGSRERSSQPRAMGGGAEDSQRRLRRLGPCSMLMRVHTASLGGVNRVDAMRTSHFVTFCRPGAAREKPSERRQQIWGTTTSPLALRLPALSGVGREWRRREAVGVPVPATLAAAL